MPISDKTRRQRELDQLAFGILAARHTGPETWMCWTDWFELTKAKQGDCGLGPRHSAIALGGCWIRGGLGSLKSRKIDFIRRYSLLEVRQKLICLRVSAQNRPLC
jgi:hypothetical protein